MAKIGRITVAAVAGFVVSLAVAQKKNYQFVWVLLSPFLHLPSDLFCDCLICHVFCVMKFEFPFVLLLTRLISKAQVQSTGATVQLASKAHVLGFQKWQFAPVVASGRVVGQNEGFVPEQSVLFGTETARETDARQETRDKRPLRRRVKIFWKSLVAFSMVSRIVFHRSRVDFVVAVESLFSRPNSKEDHQEPNDQSRAKTQGVHLLPRHRR